jgi:hypothetical protein
LCVVLTNRAITCLSFHGRPTHWRSSTTSLPPLSNAQRLHTHKRKPDLVSSLARTTVPRLLSHPSSPVYKRNRVTAALRYSPPATSADPTIEGEDNPPRSSVVSFVPSFVSSARTPTRESTELVEDHVFPFPLLASPQAPMASPTPRRMAGRGPLSKRLKSICDSVQGDHLRFQSGQYKFSEASMDMNDPRNRSKTHMDVTILGNSTSWDRTHQLVTVLGFVHNVTQKCGDSAANNKNDDACHSQLAWISLTHATAREQKVGMGLQLRIYNAVPVPLTIPLAVRTVSCVSGKTSRERRSFP